MNSSAARPNLSVVIPVYNSENTLRELVDQLLEVLPEIGEQYEIILVNDGSRDHSWQVIQTLQQSKAGVVGINLMRNYGQHNALLCGTRAAKFDIVITMDDDLQHPPAEIHKLLDELQKGYDVVYGTPRKQTHGLLRNLASWFTRMALQTTMSIDHARNVSAFRVFRTQVRQAFSGYQSPFVILDVLVNLGNHQVFGGFR